MSFKSHGSKTNHDLLLCLHGAITLNNLTPLKVSNIAHVSQYAIELHLLPLELVFPPLRSKEHIENLRIRSE
jgi:hypothetical protein